MNDFSREFFGIRGMRSALVGCFGLLALFLFFQTVTTAQGLGRSGVPATDTITVQGSGEATLAPDVARISYMVENTAATVADAQALTTKQSNAVLDYVKGQKISEKDVKTTSYTISPEYSYPNPCPANGVCPEYQRSVKVVGYHVSQSVQVTLRDLTMVGAMLEGLGSRGVQNLSGPNFALDDSTAGYSAARADAIMKAKTQASLLAKQLGVGLGKIVNFSESSNYGYPMPMAYGMGGDSVSVKAAAPSVPAGENTYTASVTITYEIR